MADLTEKQKIFCQEYIYDWNATRAAKVAGYSEKTAGAIGHENLSKPEIQGYIEKIQKDLEKTAGISRLRILREFEKIAFSSIAHLHDTWITRKEFDKLSDAQKDCIQEIQTQTRMEANPIEGGPPIQIDFVKVKLFDKQRALDSISKMLGYNEPDKLKLLLPEKQVMEIGGHKIEF
jgi:phage terminase small subunit